jgi:hypothetical protein
LFLRSAAKGRPPGPDRATPQQIESIMNPRQTQEQIGLFPATTQAQAETQTGSPQSLLGVIGQALAGKAHIRHLRIEDGKGRRLGRHFRVKLWPTLVLLTDGQEVGRLVRPQDVDAISTLLSMSRPG